MRHVAMAALVWCAVSVSAHAKELTPSSAVVRNELERHDQSGVPNKEIITGTVTLPAGTSVGFHVHPGEESVYVTEGSLTLKTKGQPDRNVAAGQSFFNIRGAVHSITAGAAGATILATWVVDKGVPVAKCVP